MSVDPRPGDQTADRLLPDAPHGVNTFARAFDSNAQPVRTAADLDTLDDAEIVEGYHDGRAGEPEPGGNRSRSYRHGWRVGRVDGGHAQPDADGMVLVEDVLRNGGFFRVKGQTGPDKRRRRT